MTAAEFRNLGFEIGPDGLAQSIPAGAKEKKKRPAIRMPKKRVPNKTEQRFINYITALHHPWWIQYEPFTLNLPSGTRYSADVGLCRHESHQIWLYEVKGPHIHNRRSIHAFKEAVAAFPMFYFVFAQYVDGKWLMTDPT